MKTLKIRNKNAILELLKSGANFEKITLVDNLKQDNLTKEIVSIAMKRRVPINKMSFKKMVKGRSGQSREVLVGFLVWQDTWSLKKLLDSLNETDKKPFFLLLNKINYESNIGIIARTAFAAGVNGIIFQGDENQFINEETLHLSVGTIARIPLVKMNIFQAIKELKKTSTKIFSIQMDGESIFKENLSGPIAFVLGAEGKGLSEEVSKKCDKKLSIPMRQGIDSLNVGISAAIVIYEKVRQEGKIV
ncbi:RNA methyltransferase [Candidatus Pacearchaeota archaeon]|nr:RNA methyltransferase [Candidatus Pacearchaeota archaeon]